MPATCTMIVPLMLGSGLKVTVTEVILLSVFTPSFHIPHVGGGRGVHACFTTISCFNNFNHTSALNLFKCLQVFLKSIFKRTLHVIFRVLLLSVKTIVNTSEIILLFICIVVLLHAWFYSIFLPDDLTAVSFRVLKEMCSCFSSKSLSLLALKFLISCLCSVFEAELATLAVFEIF